MNVVSINESPSRLEALDTAAINKLMLANDWTELTPEERIARYRTLCGLLQLDWRELPLDLIRERDGRRRPYITARASFALRNRYAISCEPVETQFRDGYVMVMMKAALPTGRYEVRKGAITTRGKRDQELADAEKWAETQGGRRATLALLGIGLPDESEALAYIGGTPESIDPTTGQITGEQLANALEETSTEPVTFGEMIGFKIAARGRGWKQREWLALLARYGWKHEGAIRRALLAEVTAALDSEELHEEIRSELQ